MVCFRYIIVNTLRKGDINNNNNNNNKKKKKKKKKKCTGIIISMENSGL
jgi:hypothetical protein